MGDDDNDSIFKRAQDDLMRISNLDRLDELANDPSLKKNILHSLHQYHYEADRKKKQRIAEISNEFKNLLFEEKIEEATTLLKENPFLMKEVKADASCAIKGKWKSVLFLIDNNFPVNQELVQEDDTLLAIAINRNEFQIVSKLKNTKYDLNKKNDVNRSIRQEIMEYGKKETLDVLKNEYQFNFIMEFSKDLNTYTRQSFENLKEYLSYDEWLELNKIMREKIDSYKTQLLTDMTMIESVEKTIKVVNEHLKRTYLLKSL